MTVVDQLRQAMADQVTTVPAPADRWTEIEARAAATRRVEARRRTRQRVGGLTVLALAASAAAALVVLPALSHKPSHRIVVTPATRPSTAVTTAPTSTPTGRTNPTSPTTVAPSGSGYLPLYPFSSLQQANSWRSSYEASGVQPWHLDAGQTALHFAAFLGYTDITAEVGSHNDSTGAHVTVGFARPNGTPSGAAVVHLRRFGTASDSPWEVVGTDDTPYFSVTNPHYGATATSPLAVGGAIMGVDENIRVEVLQLSSASPIGVFCCQPAGNSGAPWQATVAFHGATDNVLIVAASSGGGLEPVGRFTVTGVRTAGSPATTPGL